MDLIIDFYKGLDTINLIIFWGIIIVIILLLIFSTIIVNKNRKLKQIIIHKEKEIADSRNELAIKEEEINNIKKESVDLSPQEDLPIIKKEETIYNYQEEAKPIVEEENFIVEEHVREYHDDNQKEPVEVTIKEEIPEYPPKKVETVFSPVPEKKEISMPTRPYERNVLREMSLSQTSPIGIVKKDNNHNQEIMKAQELNDSLNNIEVSREYIKTDNYENNYKKEMDSSKEKINKIYENKYNYNQEEQNNEVTLDNKKKISVDTTPKVENNYLKQVSEKLSEAQDLDGIERTEYERKQEEDAIISYEELMQKKDSIQIIDEEDAVISIEELIKKKQQNEKLYNITKEEENDEFISELKHFRSDL